MQTYLTTNNVLVEKGKIEDALKELGSCDEDFNGNNGEDYLWKDAKGYDSNMEYLIDTLTKKYPSWSDLEQLVKEFIDRWTVHDNYYSETKFEILDIDDNKSIICFAAICGS